MEEFNVGPHSYRGLGRFRFRVTINYGLDEPGFLLYGHAPDPSSALSAAFSSMRKDPANEYKDYLANRVAEECSVKCLGMEESSPEKKT